MEKSPREILLEKVTQVLNESGYRVAVQCCPSCFDLLARKRRTLLVKVLTNVDSFYPEQGNDLKRIADVLEASSLIIGASSVQGSLRDHTIYERHGVPVVNLETFARLILNRQLPFVYAKKGGFFTHINADFLKKTRESHHLSLGDLAREAGVSKSTIQNYERGEGASVDNVLRLQEALGELVIDPINVFDFESRPSSEKPRSEFEKEISGRLGSIGFHSTIVSKAAFNMVSRQKDDIIFTGLKKNAIAKKAQDIHSARRALEQHGMFVLNHPKEKSVSGVPILDSEELGEVVTSKELLKILKELEER